MAFQVLCSVPFVVSGAGVLSCSDSYSNLLVTDFSLSSLDALQLASHLEYGFTVALPVIAIAFGARLLFSAIRRL